MTDLSQIKNILKPAVEVLIIIIKCNNKCNNDYILSHFLIIYYFMRTRLIFPIRLGFHDVKYQNESDTQLN